MIKDINKSVELNNFINTIKDYAIKNNVPIVLDDGLDIIIETIKKNNAKRLLEIGCAIGYCAINMASVDEDIIVHTIERNLEMYNIALNNVNEAGLNNRIKVIYSDALTADEALLFNDYDLIFIDAAKAQYIKFFEKFSKLLKVGGVIICDNLSFHGFVKKYQEGDYSMSRDLKALMRKVNNFLEYLKNNNDYETVFYELGDGVSVSKKLR
ncbi:MAG: O-methyltransferase [Bacilli bacterium]|nr:O-methyltransferase [Bacilli bacterium]